MNKEATFPKEPLKKGTWVTFEYDLWMLNEDEKPGQTTNISNGTVETWVNVRQRAYPLTLRSRVIGEWFSHQRRFLDEKTGPTNLNWPDIHRYFSAKFGECIEADKNEHVLLVEDAVVAFTKEIIDRIEAVGSVGGISVFR